MLEVKLTLLDRTERSLFEMCLNQIEGYRAQRWTNGPGTSGTPQGGNGIDDAEYEISDVEAPEPTIADTPVVTLQPPTTPVKITFEELANALRAYSAVNRPAPQLSGFAAVKAVLEQFKLAKLSDATEDQYPALYACFKA